jgi:hypothetical protein
MLLPGGRFRTQEEGQRSGASAAHESLRNREDSGRAAVRTIEGDATRPPRDAGASMGAELRRPRFPGGLLARPRRGPGHE